MPDLSSWLLAASALIVLVLGTLHLVFTFIGTKFHPRDAALVAQLQRTAPRISAETTMWRAGLGFHASHSAGAMLFGALYLQLAFEPGGLLFRSPGLLVLGLAYLLALLVLARRYWFRIPLRGIALSAALYAAALAVHFAQ